MDTLSGQYALYLHHQSWTQIRPQDLTRRPAIILDAVEEFGISTIALTNSMIGRILTEEAGADRSRDLSSLKSVGVGSEPISARYMQDFARLLQKYGASSDVLSAGYGATETGTVVVGSRHCLHVDPSSPVQLGAPWAGIHLRIVDDDGNIVSEGEPGELQVSCPEKMFSQYWGDPNLTRDQFTSDGWWRTGDWGQLDAGQLTLHGRVKDVAIVHGKKFALADIDDALLAVLDAGERAFSFVHIADQDAEQIGIVFQSADRSPARRAALEKGLRAAVARRFGLRVGIIKPVDTVPITRNGKLRRGELTDSFRQHSSRQSGLDSTARITGDSEGLTGAVSAIWREALNLDPSSRLDANFFELGGDSLRALTLYMQIVETFGVHIESEEFFSDPTLSRLVELVEARVTSAAPAKAAPAETLWPLPRDMRQRLLAPLETWPGERPTTSRLLIGHHTNGARPPIFWVVNTAPEPRLLATALGKDQPSYAFRSGVDVTDYNEDDIQALALRYMTEIEEILPNGPFFIGGHCQGGLIALAIAQHALRRKRHVPLLILMDWSFELQPYAGRVLFVSGRHDPRQNMRRRYLMPELAWHRAFASFEFAEISGSHALDIDTLEEMGRVLQSHMHSSVSASTTFMTAQSYRATILAQDVPRSIEPGAHCNVKITVTNDSEHAWRSTDASGLTVGVRWTDVDGDNLQTSDALARLPELEPQGVATLALDIVAPPVQGDLRMHIDVVEQGNRWFNADPAKAFTAPVRVQKMQTPFERAMLALRRRFERSRGPYSFNTGSEMLHLLGFRLVRAGSMGHLEHRSVRQITTSLERHKRDVASHSDDQDDCSRRQLDHGWCQSWS